MYVFVHVVFFFIHDFAIISVLSTFVLHTYDVIFYINSISIMKTTCVYTTRYIFYWLIIIIYIAKNIF